MGGFFTFTCICVGRQSRISLPPSYTGLSTMSATNLASHTVTRQQLLPLPRVGGGGGGGGEGRKRGGGLRFCLCDMFQICRLPALDPSEIYTTTHTTHHLQKGMVMYRCMSSRQQWTRRAQSSKPCPSTCRVAALPIIDQPRADVSTIARLRIDLSHSLHRTLKLSPQLPATSTPACSRLQKFSDLAFRGTVPLYYHCELEWVRSRFT